jgi:MFS-type transporter involved in bile tolerance (Atg22 family)
MSPILSGIADYTEIRNGLCSFLLSGVFSVMSLFFLRDKTPCGLGLGTVLASIGFWGVSFL